MKIEFHDAVRADIKLLILLAGGTGSGKTESAMRLATGLSGGQPFAVIDTENGRALHKADDYTFAHAALDEPFTPERYTDALKAAERFPVVVIDSGSHEYEGVGGVLDIQTQEMERMGNRESARMASWIQPKMRHKKFVQALLRSPNHVILCLRAEDKIEVVKDAQGKTVIRPKASLTGAQGWIPICEKRLPFEATISLLLTQDAPGVPVPIKLERRHQELVPLDQPLDERVGQQLAAWAKGSTDPPVVQPVEPSGTPSSAEGSAAAADTPGDDQPAEGGVPPATTAPSSAAGLTSLLPPEVQAAMAGDHVIPSGKYRGKRVSEVEDQEWFEAMLAAKDSPTRRAVETYMSAKVEA